MNDSQNPSFPPIKSQSYVSLRLPSSMLKKIDAIVDDRVGMTRTGWILETLDMRLKHESK